MTNETMSAIKTAAKFIKTNNGDTFGHSGLTVAAQVEVCKALTTLGIELIRREIRYSLDLADTLITSNKQITPNEAALCKGLIIADFLLEEMVDDNASE